MTDIAIIGERTFLYERLFAELGISFQFISPGILGSPFLPRYKVVLIPTGFANSQYSETLPALRRMKSSISGFVKSGGILTVFGPMVSEHNFDWLSIPLSYICELGCRNVSSAGNECSCLLCTSTPECDGYLMPGNGFETVLRDENGRAILVKARLGEGLIVATTVHEFPSAEFIRWAVARAKLAKL